MAIVRCEFGHYYDDSRSTACPHCLEEMKRDKTAPGATSVLLRAAGAAADAAARPGADEVTVAGAAPKPGAAARAGADEVTVAGAQARSGAVIDMRTPSSSDEKTVGIFKKKHGHDPVTGWLVCTKGPERGRDYRLHSGRNFVGRDPKSEVAVIEDEQISREEHCSVVFDPKKHTFLLVPGSANTYLSSETITEPIQLTEGDVIGAGSSEFVFIPFCGEGRTWEEE